MNTRVAITHRIEQRFDHQVRLSTHWLRLRPAPQAHARISAYSVRVHAPGHFLNWLRDPFENYLGRLDLPEPLTSLGIDLELIAEFEPVNPFDFLAEPVAANHPFEYPEQLKKELSPYLHCPEPTPRLREWLEALDAEECSTVQRLNAVNREVHEGLRLAADGGGHGSAERVDPEELLTLGAGSAWQLAWLLTLSLRRLGLAARFVSGPRVLLDHTAKPEAAHDSVNMHAWSEAFIPGAGWIGLDPSAGIFTTETYIPYSAAPDPLRTRPIVGYIEACSETQIETLQVRRLVPVDESWPFNETKWSDIRALGEHVERDLAQQGVTPCVGQSLSFVSRDQSWADEWNIQALGDGKRALADQLLSALRQRLCAGGALHLGQGQWFSGEPLPRWRLNCFYRSDGQPLCRSSERLGSGTASVDANTFARSLARALGVSADHLSPAYEDPLHDAWLARSYDRRVPSAHELEDPAARRELAARLSPPSAAATGYALPLAWDHAAECWFSGPWRFRRGSLFLTPGDSPLGYRLPLSSLPADPVSAIEAQIDRSTFEARAPLPDYHGHAHARLAGTCTCAPARTAGQPEKTPRTALCVQVRFGQLYVFVPPVSHAEHYAELIATIEAAAEAHHTAVTVEGYEPPEDPRLGRFTLEPDSGVLRVILPESDSWQTQLDVLQVAYEEAARLGLYPERMSLEGAPLPSGGGGRLSLAGPRPEDSPFLRRPELLRALIAYWQRHPSLSYFFAGRLVGTGGGAPRPDEGRDEALYELSLALSRLGLGSDLPLWHSDRVLRHLLTDLSGDLKHAEIRVDQLYSPESARQRLGRIVISAFETAPHARIAALQALLVQGLLGRFAREPDDGAITRWGMALHDRFMLPHALWSDLGHVIADLNAVGYPFQLEWFEGLLTRRFPVVGSVPIGTITLELQSAHEPWPLLAEEATGAGVARFIDAAHERLQVRVTGLTAGRYALACNGERVPLQATVVHGESIAGVRYKTANPPATLHPTIPPVYALVFDLIDLWTGLAVGGCTYLPPQQQLWGPIGTPALPPLPPSSGEEAEPVRPAPLPYVTLAPLAKSGRFLPHGSTLGPMDAPPPHQDPDYLYLLDLTQRA